MPGVRYIPVHLDQQQRRPIAGLDIDEDDSRVWHLTWFRQPANIKVFRAAMRRAETAVLPHGGEFIRFQSPENCPEVTAELHDWNATEPISDARQRWELTLMLAGEDGLVHEDDDDRTPLHRITCPTCVWRIAEGRIRRRERAGPEGPRGMAQHSQRIADAYARLAEVERALVLRPISKDPRPPIPRARTRAQGEVQRTCQPMGTGNSLPLQHAHRCTASRVPRHRGHGKRRRQTADRKARREGRTLDHGPAGNHRRRRPHTGG